MSGGRVQPAERGLASWDRAQPGALTAVDMIADAVVDVDYLPPVNPDRPRPAAEPMIAVPARLLAAVRADALADRDRARGEFALLAPPESPAGQVGDARVRQWAYMRPGFAELLDHPTGGA